MISASAAPAVAALLAGGLLELMVRRRIGVPLDQPNERSLHSRPVPRSGGLAIMAATLGLLGWQRGAWPPWYPAAVFAPFVVDASATLAKRMLCGERFWEAHRSHYYQRLVRMGWGHRGTALAEYALMLACGGLSLWAIGQPVYFQLAIALGLGALLACLAVSVDVAWRRARKAALETR